MKDRLLYGLFPGLSAPFIIILLFWLFRFHDLPLSQFIHQAIALKVQFKLISVGVFFADLGLFYLFLHLNKNNASKGVILAVLIYFFLFLYSIRKMRKASEEKEKIVKMGGDSDIEDAEFEEVEEGK